jgi:hypothetical protein
LDSASSTAQPVLSRQPLPPLWRSPALRWAALVCSVLLLGMGFLPLFGGPSYEFALAAGASLPASASVASAWQAVRHRCQPFPAFVRGLESGAALAFLGLAVALVHGLRVGFCDPWPGLALYGLGPAAGALMGGAWGACSALTLLRMKRGWKRGLAIWVLALSGPVLGIAISLLRFYSSPMVFAFDPFFGNFAGPLYDTVLDPLRKLTTYRAGSAASLLTAGLLASLLRIDDAGKLRVGSCSRWRR